MDMPAPAPSPTRLLPEGTRVGRVHLSVTDADRALSVWRDVVGLTLLGREGKILRLGAGDRTLVVLTADATAPVAPRSLGLYHVAIHVPTRRDLARFVARAEGAGMGAAPTDHLVTEAVYVWDHDGIGIEMTFETPWRGSIGSSVAGAYATTEDGRPHSGREPIDMVSLMAELSDDSDPQAMLPTGTRIGHVHLHVGDLDKAMAFYADTLGFEPLVMMRDWGMGDAGLGYVPHAIAFNIWSGPRAPRPPEGAAGLKWFVIDVPAKARSGILARLRSAGAEVAESGERIETADPSGNRLRLVFG
ncbi:MAG: VOC family protein [Alphaproteobacteria bacterium]|nr:VOC family protein [Alphaproteobacteria bacterium]